MPTRSHGVAESRLLGGVIRGRFGELGSFASVKSQPVEPLGGVNLIPFVTGENKSAPHDALFWRWRSQAAVLEFPWKLIYLGEKERYLFDVTEPDGETKNLLATHPDIAARLHAKLTTWCTTLQPPGLPESSNDQDNQFFAAHVNKTIDQATKRRATTPPVGADRSIQGWLCRNGTLAVKEGALTITPDAKAKAHPFLTSTDIDLVGPLTATLKVRAKSGGASTITWRTKTASFTPEKITPFDWPTSADWQEVKIELPETNRPIHLRITPPRSGTGLEQQSIELLARKGAPRVWRFNETK